MLNFLQQKNKKQIIYEYIIRFGILFLLFSFVSIIILISLFMPSFFFASYKNTTLNSQFESIKRQAIDSNDDPIKLIKNVNAFVAALSPENATHYTYSELINTIISLKNSDIKISSINISSDNKKILIGGLANTRDSLVLYERNLRDSLYYSSVEVPLSNYIRSTLSEFSITLTLK